MVWSGVVWCGVVWSGVKGDGESKEWCGVRGSVVVRRKEEGRWCEEGGKCGGVGGRECLRGGSGESSGWWGLWQLGQYEHFHHYLRVFLTPSTRVSKMTERLRETPCLQLGAFHTPHVCHTG